MVEYFSIDDVAQITLLQGNALNPYGLEQGVFVFLLFSSSRINTFQFDILVVDRSHNDRQLKENLALPQLHN